LRVASKWQVPSPPTWEKASRFSVGWLHDAFNHLLATPEQRKVFIKAAVLFMESSIDTEAILTTTCEEGHSFKKIFQQLACKMFNCFIKNLCKEQNSKIHFGKKRGPGRDAKGSDN